MTAWTLMLFLCAGQHCEWKAVMTPFPSETACKLGGASVGVRFKCKKALDI